MFFHYIPKPVKYWYPEYIWNKDRSENTVYLTFDDGPVPGVTEFVLRELEKRQMKATFFMVGENLLKYPEIARHVVCQGHGVGNHTQHHLNGRLTNSDLYLRDFEACEAAFESVLGKRTGLFRPPYGRMNKKQRQTILKTHQIVMWDVLSGDYSEKIPFEKCLKNTIRYTQNGSIVLFHDQDKTGPVLQKVLPDYLDYLQQKDYKPGVL